MRPTSWSKCTARGSGYGDGHRSRTITERPRCARRMASTRPTGPHPTITTSASISASGSLMSSPQRLVAPGADPVVAAVVVPVVGDRAGAVADLDGEAGGAGHVETEKAGVVVAGRPPGGGEAAGPPPGRGGAAGVPPAGPRPQGGGGPG